MLTRLILKASDKRLHGQTMERLKSRFPPVEKLGKGLYFYEVDLAGTQGKSDKELTFWNKMVRKVIKLPSKCTVQRRQAWSTNLVATKDLTVNLNGLTTPNQVKDSVANNIKNSIDVPASYLEKANVPGPFLAGVNRYYSTKLLVEMVCWLASC